MSECIDELLRIMAALRDPDTGCPWDVKQDFHSIAPYTIEEAYEVDDAIQRGDMEDLREELGDLLLQVVFHAQMAAEAGEFGFDDVVETICNKMTERHPHVFDDARKVDQTELREAWESTKESERRRKGGGSALDGVALALPALLRSQKLVKRAARKGFNWSSSDDALAKCEEELEELRDAAGNPEDRRRLEEELGDLLFACAAVAGWHGVDPENALRCANSRFEARFRRIEASLRAQRREMAQVSSEDLIRLWEQSKAGSA